MKKIIVLFCCLISLSAFSQKIDYVRINNGVRVVGGRIVGGGFWNYGTHMALEQYKEGNKYEIFLKVFFHSKILNGGIFGGNQIASELGILSNHGKILIKTNSGKTIMLQSIFHKIGVKYDDESYCESYELDEFTESLNSVAYYPISEEDIIEISKGIEKWRIDYNQISLQDGIIVKRYSDNALKDKEIKPNDFAKKIAKLYSLMSDENNKELQKKIKEEEYRIQERQKAQTNQSITDGF